jgi:hypothetical protein
MSRLRSAHLSGKYRKPDFAPLSAASLQRPAACLVGQLCLYIEVTLGFEVGREDLCRNFDLYPDCLRQLAVATVCSVQIAPQTALLFNGYRKFGKQVEQSWCLSIAVTDHQQLQALYRINQRTQGDTVPRDTSN